MDPLIYLVISSPVVFLVSWSIFKAAKQPAKKPNIPKPADVEVLPKFEEKVFPFQKPWDTECSACKQELKLFDHTYCSCEKQPFGHFHIKCRDRGGFGCGFKWIMKTAQ